jgi:hypothetical protein
MKVTNHKINRQIKIQTIMFYVSEISEVAPATYKSDLQKRVFGALNDLHIPFQRVDTDEAITMGRLRDDRPETGDEDGEDALSVQQTAD